MLVESSRSVVAKIMANDLEALYPAWARLYAACPSATPFQSPDWLLAWWHFFGNNKLQTLALWSGSLLVGLVPAYVLDDTLQFLGIGSSDHLDALIRPGWETEVVATIMDFIASGLTWQSCELQQLPSESLLRVADPPAGWTDGLVVQGVCPRLLLPKGQGGLRERISGDFFRDLRACRRRADAMGNVRFERASFDNCSELFETLLKLHGKRWNGQDEGNSFIDERSRRFFWEVITRTFSTSLRLYALRVRHAIAGVLYAFADARAHYCYLGGFDVAFAKISPGNLLFEHAIGQAIQEGAVWLDFLRGREAYKYRWGAEDAPNWNRSFVRELRR